MKINVQLIFQLRNMQFNAEIGHLVQGQMYHIPKNLASNVNLSYCMNLWTLESKLHKNRCWTFFQ